MAKICQNIGNQVYKYCTDGKDQRIRKCIENKVHEDRKIEVYPDHAMIEADGKQWNC